MKITFEHYDTKITWENKRDDLNSTEVLNAFKGVLVAATYLEEGIITSMEEIVEEYKSLHKNDDSDYK